MLRKLILALAFCGACPTAYAAVAFDAKGSAECTGATSPVTCSNQTIGSITNGVEAVLVDYSSGAALSASTVTWNGVAATLIGSQFSTPNAEGTALYCLAAPASGAHTLSVAITAAGLSEIHAIGISFSGANQTTPCKNYAPVTDQTATTASVTVTSTTGDIVVGVENQSTNLINSVNNTQIVISNVGPSISFAGNYASGASTVAMTATGSGSAVWQLSGMDIAAAAGGAGHKDALTIDEDGAFAP